LEKGGKGEICILRTRESKKMPCTSMGKGRQKSPLFGTLRVFERKGDRPCLLRAGEGKGEKKKNFPLSPTKKGDEVACVGGPSKLSKKKNRHRSIKKEEKEWCISGERGGILFHVLGAAQAGGEKRKGEKVSDKRLSRRRKRKGFGSFFREEKKLGLCYKWEGEGGEAS